MAEKAISCSIHATILVQLLWLFIVRVFYGLLFFPVIFLKIIIIIVLTAEKRNNKIKSDKKLTEIGDNFSSRNIKCRSPAERISLHEHGLPVFVGNFFIFL